MKRQSGDEQVSEAKWRGRLRSSLRLPLAGRWGWREEVTAASMYNISKAESGEQEIAKADSGM